MPATSVQVRKYRQRLRERAFEAIGGKCVFCGKAEELHAAHVLSTGLRGAGRGLDRRFRDVLKHPGSYRPICKGCHKTFDALVSLREKERDEEPIPF